MKKSIIIILSLFSLASCSNNSVNEQPEKTIIIETTTAEETTQEIEIPPATERESLNEILYEDDNVTIIYDGYESLATVQRLYLTVKNKRDNLLRCNMIDFKANGIAIAQNYGTKIDPYGAVSNYVTMRNTLFQDQNITRVDKMELTFNIQFDSIIEKVTGQNEEVQATIATGGNIESYDTGVLTIER